jgi:hypothetical protein
MTVELVPEAGGVYSAVTSETEGLFAGGEELSFTATGDSAVPAHAGSVQAPFPVTVTQPDTSRLIEAPLGQDLAFVWTPATYGNLVLSLLVRDTSGTDATEVTTRCEFDGARGTGSIPAAALSRSPRTVEPAVLSVGLENATQVEAGSCQITFRAASLTQTLVLFE